MFERDRRPAGEGLIGGALVLFTLSMISEYRVRIGVSADVAELLCYPVIAAVLVVPPRAPAAAAPRRLWLAFGLLAAVTIARAFYLGLFRRADAQSPFSVVRDALLPLLLVLLVRQRVRLGPRAIDRLELALLGLAGLLGVVGIIQFFTGRLYLFDAIDITVHKTRYAKKYFITQLLHLDVTRLARGFHYFAINYALAAIVPALVAFSTAVWGRGARRILGAAAFLLAYAGIYLSFTRSVVGLLPVACALVVLGVRGALRPALCLALVLGYITASFIIPHVAPSVFGGEDIGTLTDRLETLRAYPRCVARDPAVLLVGMLEIQWHEWETLVPHNWIVHALTTEGAPVAILRIGCWIGLLVASFPARRGVPGEPLRVALWCGAFTLLTVVGETEPLSGIAPYLSAGLGLAVLAAADPGLPGFEEEGRDADGGVRGAGHVE